MEVLERRFFFGAKCARSRAKTVLTKPAVSAESSLPKMPAPFSKPLAIISASFLAIDESRLMSESIESTYRRADKTKQATMIVETEATAK